jgi:hypothetical protein
MTRSPGLKLWYVTPSRQVVKAVFYFFGWPQPVATNRYWCTEKLQTWRDQVMYWYSVCASKRYYIM